MKLRKFYSIAMFATVVASALVAPAQATPTLTNIGINGGVSTYDCAVRAGRTCRYAGNPLIGNSVLSDGFGAFAVNDPLRGSANAFGRSSTTSYLPELHAYASSNASYSPSFPNPRADETGFLTGVADANIWGVQGYFYTGLTPFELSITVSAHSVFSADGQNGKVGHSFFSAAIWDASGYTFSYEDFDCAPIYNRCSQTGPNGGITPFDSVNGILFDTGTLTLTLHHTVNSGDRFYVGGMLDANVCCGQTVDSSHTLNMAFNDYSQLESMAVSGVVPEPASIALLVLGLIGLEFSRRKKQSAA